MTPAMHYIHIAYQYISHIFQLIVFIQNKSIHPKVLKEEVCSAHLDFPFRISV